MALNTDWKDFLSLLVSCDVEFLIVGAWARAVYGEPRMTGDIDFWVKPEPENASRVIEIIRKFGFESLGITEIDFLEQDQVIQLGLPPRRIDLLMELTDLDFETSWRNRLAAELDGLPSSRFLAKNSFETSWR